MRARFQRQVGGCATRPVARNPERVDLGMRFAGCPDLGTTLTLTLHTSATNTSPIGERASWDLP